MLSFASAVTICAVAVAALLVAERRGSSAGKWASKPVASLAFVAAALPAGLPPWGYGAGIVLGLGLSVAGDLLLIPRGRGWFRAGLVAFLLGHVAYLAAFVARGVAPLASLAAGALALVIAIVIARWLLPHVKPPAMRVPVLAYVTVISTMVALAVGTVAAHGGVVILAGAVGFYLSDLAVARERFVAPGFVNRAWGLPLYYAAQLALAWTARA